MSGPGRNWVEYGLEAFGLGLFMVAACGFGVLLFHPGSWLAAEIPSPLLRRLLMGVAMGLTLLVNVYAPWGRRSGSHLNPAVTATFLRLGRIAPADAAGYIAGQFLGAGLGTGLAALALGDRLGDPAVNYVVTVPGPRGPGIAFVAEAAITFLLMLVVLTLMARPRLARYTGVAAATLVASYITVESPLSGMSMNPARTAGSALLAMTAPSLWVYFLAPTLGMLAAAALAAGESAGACAKLHHDHRYRCAFCEWRAHRSSVRLGSRSRPVPTAPLPPGARNSRGPLDVTPASEAIRTRARDD